MTKAVQALFCEKQFGAMSELVYPARDGGQMEAISDTFDRVVLRFHFFRIWQVTIMNKGISNSIYNLYSVICVIVSRT